MSRPTPAPAHARTPPRRVVVACIRYLGDTLLLRPPLRALRRAFPDAAIHALVAGGTEVALDGCPDVDRVMGWPRGRPFAQAALAARLAAARYEWFIDFTGNDRSAALATLSMAPVRACWFRPRQPWYALRNRAYNVLPHHPKIKPHIVHQRLDLLRACGVECHDASVGLLPHPQAARWADDAAAGLPRPRLHVHLCSRDMQKSVPAPIARATLAHLVAMGAGAVLTHGPDHPEADYAKAVARCGPGGSAPDAVRVISGPTWHQLVALIAACDAYWGADTAPTHAAAALARPMLVHFGPSRAEHWHPLYPDAESLVSPCPCLRDKSAPRCPPGVSGRCFDALDPLDLTTRLAAKLRLGPQPPATL